jgi:hypothetical protein
VHKAHSCILTRRAFCFSIFLSSQADYGFLLETAQNGTRQRDAEALALRTWGKEQTDTLRAGLDDTQATLEEERPRLMALQVRDVRSLAGA